MTDLPHAFSLKKSLGQHFLKDEKIASSIVERFLETNVSKSVLEVGPGMGVLTKYLAREKELNFYAIELDERMISYLQVEFPSLGKNLFHESILDFDFDKIESPVLIVQGTKDPLCALEAGPIFSALKRLDKTVELVLYEGEDHHYGAWDYDNIKDYYRRVFGWLEKYL